VLWSYIESKDNRTTQALFFCLECGFEENAGVVDAIKRKGWTCPIASKVSGATMLPAAGTY
jgi:hypothetical protein